MYAVTSLSETLAEARPARMHGVARLAFDRRHGIDRLAGLYQQAPLRVLFPDSPRGEPPLAALVTTSGGLAGGDRFDLTMSVGEGARAVAVAQAAEKIYRSAGEDTRVEVTLTAAPHAWLEFLPQETILFEGARLRRRTCIDAAAGSRVLAGEMLVFGRIARGERMSHGLAQERWEIRRDGRLVWLDALHLGEDMAAILDASAGFGGAIACATLVLVAPEAGRHLDRVRSILAEQGGRHGATMVNELLVVRWLDSDARRLREGFAAIWAHLRAAEAGLPASLPRLWHV